MLVSRYRPAFSARTRSCEVTDCPGSTRSTSIFDGPRRRTSPTGSLTVNITFVHVPTPVLVRLMSSSTGSLA